jgi:hypothetical protein
MELENIVLSKISQIKKKTKKQVSNVLFLMQKLDLKNNKQKE